MTFFNSLIPTASGSASSGASGSITGNTLVTRSPVSSRNRVTPIDERPVMRTWSEGTRIRRPASVTIITPSPGRTAKVPATAVPVRGERVMLAIPCPPRPLTRYS